MRKLSVTKWLAAGVLAAGVGSVSMGPSPGNALGLEDPCTGQDCTQLKQETLRSDRELYNAGYWLAQAERYPEALQTLRQAKDQNNPAILNYIGYSMRKMGDVDGALVHYQKAITIAPDYNLARSYMGEAYLQKGDRKKAWKQLVEIKNRCGTGCQEYDKLAKAIKDWDAKRQG